MEDKIRKLNNELRKRDFKFRMNSDVANFLKEVFGMTPRRVEEYLLYNSERRSWYKRIGDIEIEVLERNGKVDVEVAGLSYRQVCRLKDYFAMDFYGGDRIRYYGVMKNLDVGEALRIVDALEGKLKCCSNGGR